MNELNDEYYVVERPSDSSVPLLKADKNSSAKKYWTKEYKFDGQPLIFSNKKKEKNLAQGISEKISSILFTPDEIVINASLYSVLSSFNIEGVEFIPAVYIANTGEWHEDYWYVKIVNDFDCWSRKLSKYNPEARTSSGWHYVYKYVLDIDVIDRVPLKQRMLFNMGGVSMPVICAHSSVIMSIKLNPNVMDDFFIPLAEYEG